MGLLCIDKGLLVEAIVEQVRDGSTFQVYISQCFNLSKLFCCARCAVSSWRKEAMKHLCTQVTVLGVVIHCCGARLGGAKLLGPRKPACRVLARKLLGPRKQVVEDAGSALISSQVNQDLSTRSFAK
ncbi:hypothetical protein Fmac_020223 [Flemingia macrophylla]|uniref:Uncharacterized protein n=1 Tax=Flemingia macrophylla TaxID=520843 RepID=A0ABD1LTJ9_9FABA